MRTAGIVASVLLSACWQTTRPSLLMEAPSGVPVESVAPETPRALAPRPIGPSEEPTVEVPALMSVGPALVISAVSGVTPQAIGRMLAPAAEALEDCKTTSTGKLVLRLIAEPGSTHLRVIDSRGVDASTNRCALSALGTFEVDESIQQSWSRVDAARRVETQLVLSW